MTDAPRHRGGSGEGCAVSRLDAPLDLAAAAALAGLPVTDCARLVAGGALGGCRTEDVLRWREHDRAARRAALAAFARGIGQEVFY